jgi:hypothetical protein
MFTSGKTKQNKTYIFLIGKLVAIVAFNGIGVAHHH